ncbi:MAG: tetratricopeptide repeat protein, partial [Pseudomonadota bacterium]
MFTSLRISLLTAILIGCSVFFSQPSFAISSLFKQFSESEQWQEKQQLAKKLLKQDTTNQEQSLDIYLQLADFALDKGNFSAAVKNYQLAEQSTSFAATPKRYFRSLKMQGVTYYYQGLMQQAVLAYSKALSVAKKLPEPIAEANLLSNIGLAYFDMFNMDQAQ